MRRAMPSESGIHTNGLISLTVIGNPVKSTLDMPTMPGWRNR
jgi:hypothetical protein